MPFYHPSSVHANTSLATMDHISWLGAHMTWAPCYIYSSDFTNNTLYQAQVSIGRRSVYTMSSAHLHTFRKLCVPPS